MREHWENVYRGTPHDAVSWHRPQLDTSLALLERAGLCTASRVIDIGGGASTLVDDLVARGIAEIIVLDLAQSALDVARRRVASPSVRWRCDDVTTADLPAAYFTHWHDRAVLHFLTDAAQADAYARQAAHALAPGGHAIVGGFAPEGPQRCSGLPVARRSPEDIAALMGPAFALVHAARDTHRTPAGRDQAFAWALLQRR